MSETAGINGREEGEVVKRVDMRKDPKNGLFCRYHRKPFFPLNFQNREKVPVGFQDKSVIKLDPEVAQAESLWRPFGRTMTYMSFP